MESQVQVLPSGKPEFDHIAKLSHTRKPPMVMLVDIENVAGFCAAQGREFDAAPIIERLATIGNPVIRHSFGDISAMPKEISKFKLRQNLQRNHVTHEDVPHLPGLKNSADIRLVVDAMHLAHTRPDIGCFVFVGHDRDFIFPMNYLRGLGRTVIGVGPSRAQVNPIYQSACDLFLFYDELAGKPVAKVAPEPARTVVTPLTVTTDNNAARLIEAIRGVEARGTTARAPVVSALMRTQCADFDPKKSHGSFKQFCQRVAETGLVQLSDLANPAFALSVTAAAEAVPVSPLADAYHVWILRKMKMSMPTTELRQSIYAAMADVLANRREQLPVPLKTLAADIGQRLPDMENVAFRILYGLFRCRALTCALSGDSFNPGVVAIKVPVEQLDLHFVVNTLSVFRRDNTGLPLDPAAWSEVFHGDTSAAQAISTIAELDNLADMGASTAGT